MLLLEELLLDDELCVVVLDEVAGVEVELLLVTELLDDVLDEGALTITDKDCVSDVQSLVAATTKLYVPALVGVPTNSPSSVRVMPGGRLPEASDQTKGSSVLAISWIAIAIPVVWLVMLVVVITTGSHTSIVYALLSVPAVLLAETINEYVPMVVGVPVRYPVEPFSDKPVGSVPEANLNSGAVPVATMGNDCT